MATVDYALQNNVGLSAYYGFDWKDQDGNDKSDSTVQTLTTNSNLIVINTKETPSGVSFLCIKYIELCEIDI